MPGQLVLVDDEPGLRDAIQAYLEESGFTVHTASNGAEGWELVQRVLPELVVSDVMMPQVDGYQFLATLRGDERFQSIPVIFLTARGMTSDRIQGYEAGVDAYLPKPFDPDELVAVVKNLLGRQAKLQAAAVDDETISIAELARQMAEIRAMLQQKGSLAITPPPVQHDFTPREQSVLELVVDGLMNKEIAKRLETSVRNVEKYVSRLFSKTGTSSRTELVRYSLEHGLIRTMMQG
jgi:DNA-binding NarL/FixJ family response regulator